MDKAPDAFRTISEVADDLDIPQHVLRFWETRFAQIKPMKRSGGRRYYRPDDVALLRGIRRLLYGEGYTIRGVQRILREQGIKAVQALADAEAPSPSAVTRPRAGGPKDAAAVFAGEEAIEAEDFDATEDAEDAAAEAIAARGYDAGDDEEHEGQDEGEADGGEAEDEEDDAEPAPLHRPVGVAPPVVAAPRPQPRPAEPPRPSGLPRAEAMRLRGALDDLLACKRLIDDAIKTSPPELFPIKD